jgi:hypothetical protein
MYDVKSIFASKTVWGGLIAVAAALLGLFGYTITPADQVAVVEAVAAIGSAVGGVLAIYGRIVATKRIGT